MLQWQGQRQKAKNLPVLHDLSLARATQLTHGALEGTSVYWPNTADFHSSNIPDSLGFHRGWYLSK